MYPLTLGITTFCIMIFSRRIPGIMSFSIRILGITTFSIMTFSITTFCVRILGIMALQTECWNTECL